MFNHFLTREVKKKEMRDEEERNKNGNYDKEIEDMSIGEFKKEAEADFGKDEETKEAENIGYDV